MPFDGFPPQTLAFLERLRAKDAKEWLEAHRDEYERWYVEPAKAFVLVAGELLREFSPAVRAEPKILGSIFRIHRDARRKGADGRYKDHLDLYFWEGQRREAVSGYFIRIAPEFVGIGAGSHGLAHERHDAYRRAVTGCAGVELAEIVERLEQAGRRVEGSRRRDADAPPRERLAYHRALYVHHEEPSEVAVDGERLLASCRATWGDLVSLHRWLVRHVQRV
jgi:uncharacterized protein (TIGR02453 family)